MPYKIVQTHDNGLTELSIVPSHWEARGKLYWPPKNVKNRARLIKDERTKPSLEWNVMDCNVKRQNISTYKEAEIEITIMQANTDTDNEVIVHSNRQQPVNSQGQEINFDAWADMLIPPKNLPVVIETASTEDNVIITEQSTGRSDLLQMCSFESSDQILANQASMLEKINTICQTLTTIIDNQKRIAHKLALLSVQIEDSNSKIIEKIDQPVNVTVLNDAKAEERDSFIMQPIEDQKQLEDLEVLLLDKAQREKLKKRLCLLFSSAAGNGTTCAYRLLDCLFSRDFLCKCSWSGGSRGELSKITLKDFKMFLKFFFDIIYSWDSSFTMDGLENFFKIVLKNALKRKAMKNLRASTKRSRKTATRKDITDNSTNGSQKQGNQLRETLNENLYPEINENHNENETHNAENSDRMETGNESVNEELDLC